MSTSSRIKVDILCVINLNPQKNLKCVLFQCFFYCKNIIKNTNKTSELKKKHYKPEGTVVPHTDPSKATSCLHSCSETTTSLQETI